MNDTESSRDNTHDIGFQGIEMLNFNHSKHATQIKFDGNGGVTSKIFAGTFTLNEQ